MAEVDERLGIPAEFDGPASVQIGVVSVVLPSAVPGRCSQRECSVRSQGHRQRLVPPDAELAGCVSAAAGIEGTGRVSRGLCNLRRGWVFPETGCGRV
jgi:hypothetical protein